jgi:hypothetical protein
MPITTYIPHAVLTAIGSALLWFARALGSRFKRDWDTAMEKLGNIEQKVSVQAENHLYSIQEESKRQTTLLQDMVKEQAETNGYLKAVVELKK